MTPLDSHVLQPHNAPQPHPPRLMEPDSNDIILEDLSERLTEEVAMETWNAYRWISAGTVFQVTIAFSLTVSIVFVNLIVLLVRVKDRKLRKQVSSSFITSLSVSDLCVGLCQALPGLASMTLLSGESPGYWWIKLSVYGRLAFGAVSMYSVMCISFDRYIAVTQPLRYWTLVHGCRTAIVLCWGAGMLVPFIALTPLVPCTFSVNSLSAVMIHSRSLPFIVAIIHAVYAPTAVTLLVVYTRIVRISRRHVQRIEQDMRRASVPSVSRKTKYLRNSVFIVVIWFVQWLPHAAYTAYEMHGEPPVPWAEFLTLWLTFSNNFTNAIIYNWFHKDFRRALRETFYFIPFYGKKATYEQLIYSIDV